MKGWTLDDIPWDQFDPHKVDQDTLKVVKAASLVEHNGEDYARYLANIFADDPDFRQAAWEWAQEEVQHGRVLRRWAELADPDFDFDAAFARFRAGYQLPQDGQESVRGSRVGELVSRCVIETGTSCWYTAVREGCDEPVLREICRQIAADELRHYKLFYAHLQRYLAENGHSRWSRLRVAAGRVAEADDDELAYAYYAANGGDQIYDRRHFNQAYARTALGFYRPHHVDRSMGMLFKAVGLDPQSWLRRVAANLAWRMLSLRTRRLQRGSA